MQQQNERIFVPIGVDCGGANYLRDTHRRMQAFPFDWMVTYGGVATCFREQFQRFLPADRQGFNQYNMCFYHDYLDRTGRGNAITDDKFRRRFARAAHVLTSSSQVVFWRKSHMKHHHDEHGGKFQTLLPAEIAHAEEFSDWLRHTHPTLDYYILVTLCCQQCFPLRRHNEFRSTDPRVLVANCPDPEGFGAAFDSLVSQLPAPSAK